MDQEEINKRNEAIAKILLDISIDVQNELLRQCRYSNCDDWQSDRINENTISVFALNKQKYINQIEKCLTLKKD